MNQNLSMEHAQVVISCKDCNVPVRFIVAPGAMGTADPVATNAGASFWWFRLPAC